MNSLDTVIGETIQTLENGREQLFAIAENARNECERLEDSLAEISSQLNSIDLSFNGIKNSDQEARALVNTVTGNFENHTEAEIKTAFEQARELQVKITQLIERRNQLDHKKEELEKSLLNQHKTAEKAENMVSQVGVVMDFIRGNLKDINTKLETLHQSQQMGMQIIKAQEEERKRVAREIHDGPAQSMANIVLRIEFCEKLMEIEPVQVSQELKNLKEFVKDNLKDLRKIIYDLRPMALDDLGVVPAIKRHIENVRESSGLNISLEVFGREFRLDPVLEIALFRLIQEALTNVVKHAAASEVTVVINVKNNMIQAMVQDNGKGFELSGVFNSGEGIRYGLISMRERISLLGGEMELASSIGEGTRITFTFPL